jgi:hypothetical protein
MPYVVKATGSGLGGTWLAPAPPGFHAFGPLQIAMVFQSQAEAQAAADKASKCFGRLSMSFAVEVVD